MLQPGMTINIPSFSDNPNVTVNPGDLDVETPDQGTVRGVNPYAFGGPGAFFEQMGGAAGGPAMPTGDIAAGLGDNVPQSQRRIGPLDIVGTDEERAMLDDLRRQRDNVPPPVPSALPTPSTHPGGPGDVGFSSGQIQPSRPGGRGDVGFGSASDPIPTYGRARGREDYIASGTPAVQAIAGVIEGWGSFFGIDPAKIAQFEGALFEHQNVSAESRLRSQEWTEQAEKAARGGAVSVQAWLQWGLGEAAYRNMNQQLSNEIAPGSEAAQDVRVIEEEVNDLAGFTDGPVIPRTQEQYRNVAAARLTGLFMFGEMLGGASYAPDPSAEMPRIITEYVAKELPFKPASSRLKQMFSKYLGTEGFETWEDMLRHFNYEPDPLKPWQWVRQDKVGPVGAYSGIFPNYATYGSGYNYGGGRRYGSSGGSGGSQYKPMAMWRIGFT